MTQPGASYSEQPFGSFDGAATASGVLDARSKETAGELARFDVHLGGLFRVGHAMLERLAVPGTVYLVAHCGRELANGVVRMLAPDLPELLDGERATVPAESTYRLTVARALGERPDHPSVDRWVRVARVLQENAHVRLAGDGRDAPDPEAVGAGFLALSDLLYGRLAPFFTAQADLESLAEVPSPTPADLERLRPLLVRPAQRRRFFGELAHAGWFPLPHEGGFLKALLLVTRLRPAHRDHNHTGAGGPRLAGSDVCTRGGARPADSARTGGCRTPAVCRPTIPPWRACPPLGCRVGGQSAEPEECRRRGRGRPGSTSVVARPRRVRARTS